MLGTVEIPNSLTLVEYLQKYNCPNSFQSFLQSHHPSGNGEKLQESSKSTSMHSINLNNSYKSASSEGSDLKQQDYFSYARNLYRPSNCFPNLRASKDVKSTPIGLRDSGSEISSLSGSSPSLCPDSSSSSTTSNKSTKSVRFSEKINIAPISKKRNPPGTTISKLRNNGINVDTLDPVVVRRLKNTESARRSRVRRKKLTDELEARLDAQADEIDILRNRAASIKAQIDLQRKILEANQLTLLEIHQWLHISGIEVPAEVLNIM